jgi:hypothetical protein
MSKLKLGDIVVHKAPTETIPNIKMNISCHAKIIDGEYKRSNKETKSVYCKYFNEPTRTFVQAAFNINELKKVE